MKNVKQYIKEALRIKSGANVSTKIHKYFPKTKQQLQQIILERMQEEGANVDLNDIDTSAITDMSHLFDSNISRLFAEFNGKITLWNVSNVTDMQYMFSFCKKFNGNLSGWNLKNVEDAKFMFKLCESFEGKGLEKWDVSNIEVSRGMFFNCKKFNTNISKWKLSKCVDASFMFDGCTTFNQDLSSWDLRHLYDYEDMFYCCPINLYEEKQPKFK